VFCSVVVRWHTSDPYPPLALSMVSSLISMPTSWVGGASVLGCWMEGTSLDEKKAEALANVCCLQSSLDECNRLKTCEVKSYSYAKSK
jgi:hypothetical protein